MTNDTRDELIETAFDEAFVKASNAWELSDADDDFREFGRSLFDAGLAQLPTAVDMLLWCPRCFEQHVDEAKPDVCESCGHSESEHFGHKSDDPDDIGCYACGGITENGCQFFTAWLNPPHKSHRCNFCNHIWRPADTQTNGVAAIQTKGKDDTWSIESSLAVGQSMSLSDRKEAIKKLDAEIGKDGELTVVKCHSDLEPPKRITKAYCEMCECVQPVTQEYRNDELNPSLWGDILCNVCHGIITTVEYDDEPNQTSRGAE